jgi:hypothetical protein
MAYTTQIALRGALQEMDVAGGAQPWVWEQDKKAVNPELEKKFPYGRAKVGKNVLNDMTEYCWLAYSKSKAASGPHIIGRTDDLWIPEYLELSGITDRETQTLWDKSVEGNIQKIDKWSPVVNDCWVLGGVHRQAPFQLISVRSLKNLWDFDRKDHVVTAREILGLFHFGYSMTQGPASLCFTCTDVAKADAATLQEYSSFMKHQAAMGPDSIRSLLVVDSALTLDPAMKKAIEGFDKSRLRRVTPPR